MPKVPKIQEGQRLNPQNPTGFRSSSQARLFGDSVSSAGRGLANFGKSIKKVKGANKALAAQDAKNRVNRRMNVKLQELKQKGYTEDALKSFAGERDTILKEVGKEVSDLYGSEYGDVVRVAADQASVDWDKKAGDETTKQLLEFSKQRSKEVEAGLNGQAFQSPDFSPKFMKEGTDTFAELSKQFRWSEAKEETTIRRFKKGIANSTIDGYINAGRYMEARGVLQRDFKELYDSQETREAFDRITQMQRSQVTFDNSQIDRDERLNEKDLKKRSERFVVNTFAEMEKAEESGNIAMVESLKNKAFKVAGDGDLTFQSFGKILTKGKEFYAQTDSVSKMEIRKKVYGGALDKDFDRARQEVAIMVKTERMLPKTAAALYKEFDAQQKAFSSDPVYKVRFKQATAMMSRLIGDDTKFDAMTRGFDVGEKREYLAKMKGVEEVFYGHIASQASSGANPDPMRAAIVAIDSGAYESVFLQVPVSGAPALAVPNVKDATIGDIDNYINELDKYQTDNQFNLNPMAIKKIEAHKQRMRAYIEVQKFKAEFQKTQDELKSLNQDINRSNTKEIMNLNDPQMIDNIMQDVDNLLIPDEDGIPFIERLAPVR